MIRPDLNTIEEVIKGHRDNVKRSVPIYKRRRRLQLLEHFDQTVALYEGTVGHETAALQIESSVRPSKFGSFEKAMKTTETFSKDRLVQLVKSCPDSRIVYSTMTLADSVAQTFDNKTISDSLMTCLETYREKDVGGFDQIIEPIKRSLKYHDSEVTKSMINLISSCVGKGSRFNIVEQCLTFPQFLEDKESYEKAIGLLDSYKDHIHLKYIITLLRNTIGSLKDKEILDLVVYNLEKYRDVKHGTMSLVPNVTNLLGTAINVGKHHNYDGSFDDKFKVDVEDLRGLTSIIEHYFDNKSKLRKIIDFSDNIISRTHNLKFSNSIARSLENYSSLQSFRFENIASIFDSIINEISRENNGDFDQLSYLDTALALPKVVKTISSYSGDATVLNCVTEAILNTAVVCPEEETVNRIAEMLHPDIVGKTALQESKKLSQYAYDYKKFPKGFRTITKLCEQYMNSTALCVVHDVVKEEFGKFDSILGNTNLETEKIKEAFEDELDKSVKKLNTLTVPKVKTFLEDRLGWPGLSNLALFIVGCYSNNVSLGHITPIAEELRPYLECDNYDIVLKPLEKALVTCGDDKFKLGSIYFNLKNPNVIKYFDNLPEQFETVAKPLGLMVARGNSNNVDQILNLLHLYRNTTREVQEAICRPLARKIDEVGQTDFDFNSVSKVIGILSRPKIVERINGNKEFYHSCNSTVNAIALSACVTEDPELVDIISDYLHNNQPVDLSDISSGELIDISDIFSGRLIDILNKDISLERKLEFTKTVAKHLASIEVKDHPTTLGAAAYCTAKCSNDISYTKEVIKLVDKYKGNKGCELITSVIAQGANNSIHDLIPKLKHLSLPEFEEAVNLYQDKPADVAELAIGSLTSLINVLCVFDDTKNDSTPIKHLAGMLTKYHSHIYNEKILDVIERFITCYSHSHNLSECSDFIDNCPDIYNVNLNNLETYFMYVKDYFTDKEFKSSLTSQDIDNLIGTYNLISGTCESWDEELKEKALEGFGKIMDQKVKNGKTIAEKRRILNEWSSNVYQMIINNPEALNFMRDAA
jgi:hypothetical protein